MKYAALFFLGVLSTLTVLLAPRMVRFHDTPSMPEGWAPKFRRWENGVEVHETGN